MLVYWLLFFGSGLVALTNGMHHARSCSSSSPYNRWVIRPAFMTIVTAVIGLRVEVGADWERYLHHFDQAASSSLAGILELKDPGYQFISWISARVGAGIWGVNTVCGLIVSAALVVFCRRLPRPWLSITAGIPYLVIVVAMGYSRQGVALAFVMVGLVALVHLRVWRFVGWVMLGAAFHKSAVVVLPLAALMVQRSRIVVLPTLFVLGAVAYFLFLDGRLGALYRNYVLEEYHSEGAFVRVLMNAVPGLFLLFYPFRIGSTGAEVRLWRWCALISVGLLGAVVLLPATTLIDRVALYLIPFQLVFFSWLPGLLGKTPEVRMLLTLAVIIFYAIVLYVWLNYASHAHAWLPYRNLLLE
jgi:hypothetical protein